MLSLENTFSLTVKNSALLNYLIWGGNNGSIIPPTESPRMMSVSDNRWHNSAPSFHWGWCIRGGNFSLYWQIDEEGWYTCLYKTLIPLCCHLEKAQLLLGGRVTFGAFELGTFWMCLVHLKVSCHCLTCTLLISGCRLIKVNYFRQGNVLPGV